MGFSITLIFTFATMRWPSHVARLDVVVNLVASLNLVFVFLSILAHVVSGSGFDFWLFEVLLPEFYFAGFAPVVVTRFCGSVFVIFRPRLFFSAN